MTRASAFVLGYHGCDMVTGEKVLAGKAHLRSSENDYDWLGSGIYFWENSARRALDWAKFARDNPQLTRWLRRATSGCAKATRLLAPECWRTRGSAETWSFAGSIVL